MLHKILLVTKREYLTRVRKKSFIVMTIAAPLLITTFYGVMFYFAINRDIGATKKDIYVSDKTGNYVGALKNNDNISFTYGLVDTADQQSFLGNNQEYYGLLVTGDSINDAKLITKDQAALSTVIYIEKQLENNYKTGFLKSHGIDTRTLESYNAVKVNLKTIKATEKGLESGSVGASTALGYVGAIIIYMFIFIYGVQIMRGVIEEKSNRIVEVIISSVKPFELMFGKIAGIALVGLTQFIIWIVLVTVLGGSISGFIISQFGGAEAQQALQQGVNTAQNNEVGEIMNAISGFNFAYLIGLFVFYFLGGYLFYGALFAAIGSAVDNETDTQQFMLPVTMPLIFALVLAQSAISANPNGTLAFWLSIIPFTSPVVMMVRIPFDVPLWETVLSMVCLIAGFIFTTWLAGRIYRVGILMYGKKPSYKLMLKWLFSKD